MEESVGEAHFELRNGWRRVNAGQDRHGRIEFNAEWPHSCDRTWKNFERGFNRHTRLNFDELVLQP
jgi:hypothetical protein